MKKPSLLHVRQSLAPLEQALGECDHRTQVLWALEQGERYLPLFDASCGADDSRPRDALAAARAWMRGEIKMPVAKKAAHSAHNAATERAADPSACAAARAMGHVIGTVHTGGHAVGVTMYGVMALWHRNQGRGLDAILLPEMAQALDRLAHWKAASKDGMPWAGFLLK